MVTKGIVEDIIEKNKIKVRIPIINNVQYSSIETSNSDLLIAPISCLPNFSYNLKTGDIVYIDFEDNDIGKPVILGIQKNTLSKIDGAILSLNIDNCSKISKITSIGDVSEKEFSCLKNLDKNVQKSINTYLNDLKMYKNYIETYKKDVLQKITAKFYNNNESLYSLNESLIQLQQQNNDILKLISVTSTNFNILKNKIGDIDDDRTIIRIIDDLKEKVSNLEDSYSNGYTITPIIDFDTIEYSSNEDNSIIPYSSLYECIMYDSTCYNGTGEMSIVGVLWHDTGVNNKTIRRYVQPSKSDKNYNYLLNLIGKNDYNNDWNNSYRKAGVNAFIGTLANGSVATVQTLPWNYRPWGCGSGSKGSCNHGWIQFEICEDSMSDSEYFKKIYNEAIKLTVYLCKKFNIDPKGKVKLGGLEIPTILCHWDSYLLGMGSGHYDIYDWFPKFGKCKNLTMEDIRNDVYDLILNN